MHSVQIQSIQSGVREASVIITAFPVRLEPAAAVTGPGVWSEWSPAHHGADNHSHLQSRQLTQHTCVWMVCVCV